MTGNRYHGITRQACTEAGLPFNPGFSGAEQERFDCMQATMKNSERCHTGNAFIHLHLGSRTEKAWLQVAAFSRPCCRCSPA